MSAKYISPLTSFLSSPVPKYTNNKNTWTIALYLWSGRSGSNRRPIRWQRIALPLSYARLSVGAHGGTRTPTLSNWYLKPACLPIPPHGLWFTFIQLDYKSKPLLCYVTFRLQRYTNWTLEGLPFLCITTLLNIVYDQTIYLSTKFYILFMIIYTMCFNFIMWYNRFTFVYVINHLPRFLITIY